MKFTLDSEGMHQRYEEAVSAISAFHPVLAFDLRSRDMVGPILDCMYGAAPIEENAAAFLLKMDDEIVRQAILKLEELIKELAAIHGWKTAKDVRKLLGKKLDTQEIEGPLKEYFANAADAKAHPTALDEPS